MKTKYNNQFKSLVGSDFSIDRIQPCECFLFLDKANVIYTDDTYSFIFNMIEGKNPPSINKMVYEFDNNKIRVGDLPLDEITGITAFYCGLHLIKSLIHSLSTRFGTGFEVILSYNYEHCFITFYKLREGVNNVMSNDLEAFQMEAILRVEI